LPAAADFMRISTTGKGVLLFRFKLPFKFK
jgi:hypothetical protein